MTLRFLAVRRTLAVGAVTTLAAATLAACGSPGSPAASSSTAPSSAAPSSGTSSTADGPVTVTDAWIKASEGPMTAVFGIIANPGSSDITIVSAATSAGAMVQLHETVMKDGAMVMQEKPGGFVVPAGGTLTLEPGGNHIMVMDMPKAVTPGESVTVTLALSSGGNVTFTAVAKDYAGGNESYQPSPGSMEMSSS